MSKLKGLQALSYLTIVCWSFWIVSCETPWNLKRADSSLPASLLPPEAGLSRFLRLFYGSHVENGLSFSFMFLQQFIVKDKNSLHRVVSTCYKVIWTPQRIIQILFNRQALLKVKFFMMIGMCANECCSCVSLNHKCLRVDSVQWIWICCGIVLLLYRAASYFPLG